MMSTIPDQSREFFIQGVTHDGRVFRPSDWAERLCGVMACFVPEGYPARSATNTRLQYSPYVRPTIVGNVKCVVVNEALRSIDARAYEFVLSFAKDNDLVVGQACTLPESSSTGHSSI